MNALSHDLKLYQTSILNAKRHAEPLQCKHSTDETAEKKT
jgi:hypothetical protein